MKRFASLLFIMLIPYVAFAQILKERRVYYLDCSFSMVLNKLWDPVRDNLKRAIDNVSDETTELLVIPFAFNSLTHPELSPICAEATSEGKAMIKKQIDALTTDRSTMTYHYVPIEDFYKNRVADDRITYMFLMTDGQDEDKKQRAKSELLPQWESRYGNKNVFGFYVMLCNDAKSHEIERVVEQQEHLWKVETADVNINLVRLRDDLVFNKRNEQELVIKVEQGNLLKCPLEMLEASCNEDCYKADLLSVDKDRIICKILPKDDSISFPEETMMTLRFKPISPSQANGFTCLVNDKISIKCKDKKERTLKIRFE